MAKFNRALNRNLSAPELAAFLVRVRALPEDAKRDALEVCIDLGGQRPTQLLRLRRGDVDLHDGLSHEFGARDWRLMGVKNAHSDVTQSGLQRACALVQPYKGGATTDQN